MTTEKKVWVVIYSCVTAEGWTAKSTVGVWGVYGSAENAIHGAEACGKGLGPEYRVAILDRKLLP